MRKLSCLCVLLASLTLTAAAAPESPVAGVTLQDISGHKIASATLAVAPLVVFVAGGSSCPVLRRYLPTLNASFERWRGRGVKFVLIDLAAQDDLKTMRAEYKSYKPAFPIYLDPRQELGKKIGFVVTGEVAVLDPSKNKFIYKGAIDDRYLLGEDRHSTKENYLEGALTAWAEGKPADSAVHRAFGCAITYRN